MVKSLYNITNHSDIKQLFLSQRVTLRQVYDFLKENTISVSIKATYLPLILTNDYFLEKYQYSKNLLPLIAKIKNIIKKNANQYNNKQLKSYYLQKLLIKKSCPVDLLETFYISQIVSLRRAIAKNENCPQNILMALSKDIDAIVQVNILHNLSASSQICKILLPLSVQLKNIMKKNAIKNHKNTRSNLNNLKKCFTIKIALLIF